MIKLTRTNCAALKIGVPAKGAPLNGMCIWASVVAAKFYVHKFAYIDSRVVRVHGDSGADHYFVSVRGHATTGICDITCNQFTGGPNFIVGSLADVGGESPNVTTKSGLRIYDAYVMGADSSVLVI